MKWMHGCAWIFIALSMLGATAVQASGELAEVVSARANARAGGPTNPHDDWLLERYGALSGTPGYYRRYGRSHRHPHRYYRHHRRGFRY